MSNRGAWVRVALEDRGELGRLQFKAAEVRALRDARPTVARCLWCGKPVVQCRVGARRLFCAPEGKPRGSAGKCYRQAERCAMLVGLAVNHGDEEADQAAALMVAASPWAKEGTVPPAVRYLLRLGGWEELAGHGV